MRNSDDAQNQNTPAFSAAFHRLSCLWTTGGESFTDIVNGNPYIIFEQNVVNGHSLLFEAVVMADRTKGYPAIDLLLKKEANAWHSKPLLIPSRFFQAAQRLIVI